MSRIDFSKIETLPFEAIPAELVASILASLKDPELPAEDLEKLFGHAVRYEAEERWHGYVHEVWWSDTGVVEALARHPSLPASLYGPCFEMAPEHVVENPALGLQALLDPAWAETLAVQALKRFAHEVDDRLMTLMRWPEEGGPSHAEVAKAYRAILFREKRLVGARRFHRDHHNLYHASHEIPYGDTLGRPDLLAMYPPSDEEFERMFQRWKQFAFVTHWQKDQWRSHLTFLRSLVRRFHPLFEGGPLVSEWTSGEERKRPWGPPSLTLLKALGF